MFLNNKEIVDKNNQQSGVKTPTIIRSMNPNNLILKQNSSDNSNMNNISGGNSYNKVAANLFTNQLQSQQQQQQLQQQHQQMYSNPQTLQQKYLLQQQEQVKPQPFLYESIDYKIASNQQAHSLPFNHHLNNFNQPQILSQSTSTVGRNQSPYSGNNSYLFNNTGVTQLNQNQNLLLEKTGSLIQPNSINQQQMLLSGNPSNSNNNYLNNSINQGSVKCHSATSIQFELRDLQQERLNMKMMSNYSGTEENSPMQLRTADRFNFHRQRELSKVSRQNSEDQNIKMHQTINELEGEWNKIKKNHNLDNRSSSPFNNSLNNSTFNMAKINSGQGGQQQRLSDQINREQWNTQISDNNSVHDQSYDNTIKTQGSIKSLTSSCKRVRTQGDCHNASNNSLNKIVHTPSRKQKDQSASSIKKTQIINKSIPLSKINLDQMRTNSYSSRSQGEQVTQYSVKKDSRQNSSQLSNRNSLNNSNSLISTNTNTNNLNYNQHSSIQNKSPISRNSSQDEFCAPKSPDSTFLKIQEKYQNVHKQKTLSKHQDSSNQSINLSQSQQNNSQYLGYNNQQPQQLGGGGNNNIITNSNGNFFNLQQQSSEANFNQQYQKNSFSDLSVSPHQSQIISQYSQNNIGNGCSTLHQYPSILSQASTYQNAQGSQLLQPQSSPLPMQRYASSNLTNNNANNNLINSQNDLGNQSIPQNNSQQDSDIFHFNTQVNGASTFNSNQNVIKSPASYRNSNQITSYSQNHNQSYNNNNVNHSDNVNMSNKPQQNVYKNRDFDSKPQLHSGPSSMQQIQLNPNNQPMNYLLSQNYLISQTAVNTPSCSQSTKNGLQNRQSEQIPMIQQQLLENQNRIISQVTSPAGFSEAINQSNQKNQQVSHSKEKQIIQPVRASPMKKMIQDVKPHQQIQQSPKQNGLIKGLQGNSNNNSLNTQSHSNSNNLSYAPSSSNNNNIQQNLYQVSSGKKDMTQLIMNKIKKMNVARISLNEEDDLFFQSTDTDSYNNINSSNTKNQMNMKSRVSNIIDNRNINQNINNSDYLLQLQSQEMDHIHKTIQLQQMQSDYDFSMQETQSNNIETFSTNPLSMNPVNHKDTISPRSIPQFLPQMSADAARQSSNKNVLQNQKFFQSNQGIDKFSLQKTPEEVYNDQMLYKQKSNISPVKLSQIPSQQQENNTATSSFLNSNIAQTKESFIGQQTQQKPYIISQSNLQQTPINQKKLVNNTNYSQKLLDSIQKHAKTHQENQQNIYSTPSNNNIDMKRGIGKVINNTIKKSQQLQSGQMSQPSTATTSQQQSQQGHSQSQHIQMSQQTQLSLQPQLTSSQQQKVFNQALKSYQSTSSIQQPQNQMQVSPQQQIGQQQQIVTKTTINQPSAYNFNLHSPIAKKIY